MIDYQNYGIPQLDKFTSLLKVKLAISVAFDCIRLLMSIAIIIGFTAYAYWVYTNIPWEQVTPIKTQLTKQQHK